jgi:hypothetical protein
MTQLKLSNELEGIPISVLGSNRSPYANGAHAGKSLAQPRPSDKKACLVIPDGFESECKILFDFSLYCAQALPEIQFIWRLHPILTFESLVSKYPNLKSIPNNIVLSHNTLEEDIQEAKWALYRGSTAVVQATVAGLRPIYLTSIGELTIDPLYELKEWRETVVSISDFASLIESDTNSSHSTSNEAMLSAIKYCESFYSPIDFATSSQIFSHRVD